VRWLKSDEEMEALQPAWNALLAKARNPTPFLTPEWLLPWWQEWDGTRSWQALSLWRNEELAGLLPLCVERPCPGTRWLIFPSRLQADVLDGLWAADAPQAAALVGETLEAHAPQWDALALPRLASDSPLLRWLQRREPNGAWRFQRDAACPALPLPSDWDTLLGHLSKKFRWNITYGWRRLKRDTGAEVEWISDPERLSAAMEALFHLHARRWRCRNWPGVFCSSRVQRFHHRVGQGFLRQGWLRLALLHVGGEPVAALYAFAFAGRYWFYASGADPDWGRYSVGTLLLAAAIRRATEEGCSHFEFLRGREKYKYRWGAQDVWTWRALRPAPNLRGTLLRHCWQWEQALYEWYERHCHGGNG